MTEQTFAMVKPDGVQRGLVGEIVRRFEARGLKIAGLKLMNVPRSLAEEHYAEHRERPFFSGLVEYITSGPVCCLVLEGKNAVKIVRTVNGATNPVDAVPGTIRGDFAVEIGRNVVHGSDAPESAAREIGLYFTKDEILAYTRGVDSYLYE